jgi:hypothetical protein
LAALAVFLAAPAAFLAALLADFLPALPAFFAAFFAAFLEMSGLLAAFFLRDFPPLLALDAANLSFFYFSAAFLAMDFLTLLIYFNFLALFTAAF